MAGQPDADRRIDPEERKNGGTGSAPVYVLNRYPPPFSSIMKKAPLLMCMVDVTSARIISVSRSSCRTDAAVRLRRLSIKPASYFSRKNRLFSPACIQSRSGCIATAVRQQEQRQEEDLVVGDGVKQIDRQKDKEEVDGSDRRGED